MDITLVFCAGGNRRYADIAMAAGFVYGCRSDRKAYYPVVFADLNWQRPNLDRHMGFVTEHRPQFAVAPDVLSLEALPGTMHYAERLSNHAERVIVVPKVAGVMQQLPREPWLVVGYSVPTTYGGADAVLLWELAGWPVHLLGGSPQAQLRLAQYLPQVISVDGNSHMRAARHGVWWDEGWRTRDARVPRGPDLPYRAFARSCANVMQAWRAHQERGENDRSGDGAGRPAYPPRR